MMRASRRESPHAFARPDAEAGGSEPVFLGVDIGTGSSKGVAVRADGQVVARATRPHRTATPCPGWFEHDAEIVWWADFTGIVRELLAADGVDARAVAAVGVSGIGPCLLPADAAGRPLRRAAARRVLRPTGGGDRRAAGGR
ncbi:FGGY family carbohydrate kinase [Streptomyces sp. ME19-01-6]|uniref:FGGY family carbohydrate kinase n=1 Tax=Streptomyces sp. ME19-01-6 TaxID=3028686 RepID=UPI0029AA6492|nr:FGGY family carbohydrate kinase [Streptomyces sp. ME19-01-6]MDX3229311.1 FGGY family carbohydrate kinase [Streptomyces sp. ME19-01-6]